MMNFIPILVRSCYFWSVSTYSTRLQGRDYLHSVCKIESTTARRFVRPSQLIKLEVDRMTASKDSLTSHPVALQPACTMPCLLITNLFTVGDPNRSTRLQVTKLWGWLEQASLSTTTRWWFMEANSIHTLICQYTQTALHLTDFCNACMHVLLNC